jgi:hypothetical protein
MNSQKALTQLHHLHWCSDKGMESAYTLTHREPGYKCVNGDNRKIKETSTTASVLQVQPRKGRALGISLSADGRSCGSTKPHQKRDSILAGVVRNI